MGVVERLAAVRADIDAACLDAGREPGEVRLLPVSKTHPVELITAAYHAGVSTFGENRVQELVAKAEELTGLEGLGWAMIGHLQTNKAKDVAAVVTELQSLDSLRLARALDTRLQQLGRGLDVLVQVNSSGEQQKFGLPPADVPAFVAELAAFDSLHVRGLMTVAVNSDDQERVAACFTAMRELQTRLRDAGLGAFDDLSMGMSGDFPLAVAHGATTVRVGQAIFGDRG